MELQYALAIEIGTDKIDEDNIIPNLDAAISLCAGLIGVERESGIVRLVHETTQEYFQQNLKSWNPIAEEEIALSCLTYISFTAIRPAISEENGDHRIVLPDYPFLSYAGHFWGDHVSPVQKNSIESIFKFLHDVDLYYLAWRPKFAPSPRFIPSRGYFSNLFFGIFDEKFELWPWQSTSLHLLAHLGFFRLFEQHLLKLQSDSMTLINAMDTSGRTPLATAIYRGHAGLVKLLIELNDVDVNVKLKYHRGETHLHLAVRLEHEEIVRLLLTRKDLDTNSRDSGLRTALHRAVLSQHESIVRLLLAQESTNINLRDTFGRTSLSYAAEEGNVKLVRLLIKDGNAVVNEADEKGYTPLFYATKNGHEEVRTLLGSG